MLNFPASGSAPPCCTTVPEATGAAGAGVAGGAAELLALVVVTVFFVTGDENGGGVLPALETGSVGLLLQAAASRRTADEARIERCEVWRCMCVFSP
jgi:hypothetical protein